MTKEGSSIQEGWDDLITAHSRAISPRERFGILICLHSGVNQDMGPGQAEHSVWSTMSHTQLKHNVLVPTQLIWGMADIVTCTLLCLVLSEIYPSFSILYGVIMQNEAPGHVVCRISGVKNAFKCEPAWTCVWEQKGSWSLPKCITEFAGLGPKRTQWKLKL